MTPLLLADDDVFTICPPPPLEFLEDPENAEKDKSEAICSLPLDFKDDTGLEPPSEFEG